MLHGRLVVAMLFGALSTIGCRDQAPDSRLNHNVFGARTDLGVPATVRYGETSFANLARSVPSSAGYYFDSLGTLVVLVKDAQDDEAAITAMRAYAASHLLRDVDGRVAESRVTVRRAEFTFRQLADWRDLVDTHARSLVRGIAALDLDEAINRVTIGLIPNDEKTRSAVQNVLSAQGVPAEAIRFEDVPQSVLDVAPQSLTSETSDPIAGGLIVDLADGSCSVGFVGQRNGTLGLVSAAHCTPQVFNVDGALLWQRIQSGSVAAWETVDPGGYQCGWDTCRGSDASFFSQYNGRAMQVGLIARTQPPTAVGWNAGTGSSSLSATNPYFFVTGQADDLAVGQVVQKIGWGAGWTQGAVTHTL